MTWLRIDDGFADHPKILGLGDRAFRVHVAAMCYAARYPQARGILPAAALDRLGATPEITAELLRAGVWDQEGSGTQIHDFEEHNPYLAERAEEIREKRREAGRRGGQASARARVSQASAEANAQPIATANAQANGPTKTQPNPTPNPTHRERDPYGSLSLTSEETDMQNEAPEAVPQAVREMADTILNALPVKFRHDPATIDEAVLFAQDYPGKSLELAEALAKVRREPGKLPFPGNLRPHMPGDRWAEDKEPTLSEAWENVEDRKRRYAGGDLGWVVRTGTEAAS